MRRISTSPEGDLLLLEVSSVLLIDKNKVKIVFDREAVVDGAISWGEWERREEEADRHALTLDWGTIHELELDDILALVVDGWVAARGRTGGFSSNEGDLHELDLDLNKQEVDSSNDNVL